MSTGIGQTSTGGGQSGAGQSMGGSQSKGAGQSQMMDQGESHREGTIARTIEQQTAKIPSDVFLWGAIGSIGASAVLRLMGKKHASLFVADWVAPMLLFGVYNKIVKIHGSDSQDPKHLGH